MPFGGLRAAWWGRLGQEIAGIAVAAAVSATTACEKHEESTPATNTSTVPGKISVISQGATSSADSDVAAKGKGANPGLPAGYKALLDKPDASISDASYKDDGSGRWEVRTGPAHILYAPKDTTRAIFGVTATFEQLEKPAHPEAYGLFIGGTALDDPAKQRYTYFLVRGDGKYSVKVRNGAGTKTLVDWTAHPAIPHEDAAGKALYGLHVDSDGKVAKFSVNGRPVTNLPMRGNPLIGIAGVRINHNLHLIVTPVAVTR